ncbi:MAG TPA: CBS domain-containing protein [archaeon]|nr:CBS domain-containing protein [archaeon]
MLVEEVMNKNVVVTEPEASIREVARTMADNHIGSVIVVKNGEIVGIVTDRDVLICLAKDGMADIDQIKVKEIMTRWVITVRPIDSIEKAIELMTKYKIKKLPVVKNEKIVGILTASDIAILHPILLEKLASLLSVRQKILTK